MAAPRAALAAFLACALPATSRAQLGVRAPVPGVAVVPFSPGVFASGAFLAPHQNPSFQGIESPALSLDLEIAPDLELRVELAPERVAQVRALSTRLSKARERGSSDKVLERTFDGSYTPRSVSGSPVLAESAGPALSANLAAPSRSPKTKKPPVPGVSFGAQMGAGALTSAAAGAAAVFGGPWGLAAALALAPVAWGFWSVGARLGLAVADHLDATGDPRDRGGELKRMFNPGKTQRWLSEKVSSADFKKPGYDELGPRAAKVVALHDAGRWGWVRQAAFHYVLSVHDAAAFGRGAKSLAAMFREMAFGEKGMKEFIAPYKKEIRFSQGLLIGKAALNTGMAFSIGALTDAAIARDPTLAAVWLGVVVGAAALKALIRKVYLWNSGQLRVRMRRDFRLHLFSHLLRLPASFTAEEDPAKLAVRLTQDVAQITKKNATIPIQFPHHVIQLGLAAGFVFAASWTMALVIFAAIPLLAVISWLYGRRAERYSEHQMTRSAILTGTGREILNDAREIRSVAGEAHAAQRYKRKADRLETVMLKTIRLNSTFMAVREFLGTFFTEILVLGLGLFSYIATGAPSIGQVVSLRGYAKDARGALDGVLDLYAESKTSTGSTKRVLSYLESLPSRDRADAREFRPGPGRVEFSLEGAAFTLEPGERVLIEGGTAAARQALIDALLRLDKPGAGTVRVDGQDVAGVTRASLQNAMAYVARDPVMLGSTVRENLMFGNERALSDEQLEAALAAFDLEVGLDDAMDADTWSEASREMLALARAALREPRVWVFDGIGTQLETRRREKLWRRAAAARAGRTTLLVNIPRDQAGDVDRVIMIHSGR